VPSTTHMRTLSCPLSSTCDMVFGEAASRTAQHVGGGGCTSLHDVRGCVAHVATRRATTTPSHVATHVSATAHVAALRWPAPHVPPPRSSSAVLGAYSDEKVASREIRVWHFVIENRLLNDGHILNPSAKR
jgi:hypothetical protein